MISFEEAYNIAKTRKKVIARCVENDDAYIFSGNEELYDGLSSAVVMKDTGELTDMPYYSYVSEMSGIPKMIRSIPIEIYLFKCALGELVSKRQKESLHPKIN